VQVGWFLNEQKGGIIYDAPQRVRSVDVNRKHAKSASRCPAVINLESRHFAIPCPFDINIGFSRDKDGKPALRNLSGEASAIRGSKLGAKLHVANEVEWRHPGVPTIQLSLPYVFIADEPVYETLPQDRSVAMAEVEVTPELNDYMELISGAVNYVNQTFSLFEAAEARRPATLVKPVKR